MDDYEIFSYLKNERNNHPASFHVTSLHQVPLTQRSQKMITQTIKEDVGKPKSVENKEQLKRKKKSYFQLKLERYQKEVSEQQSKRKQELLTKSKNLLKKDLDDIQKMTNKGVREFEERCNLYSKYYSEELMTPTGMRQEDLNLPTHKYSTIENQNKYKVLLKSKPIPQPRLTSEQEFDQYQTNPDKVQLISQQLQKLNIKLIKRSNDSENQLFDAILKNDSFTVHKLLMENKNLINIRNRIQETPLHIACKRNLKEMVELLLRHQADESLKDIWGQTPRQLALKLRHLEILKVLSYI
ncbi:unnamed protein product (macronuclear) [Paramecium tetraurelia]|uniref:Uncharacterized protein n=1 Tax=Paramecium tetraurelia TaxID=5888 RepID=A0DIM9_PARTE|nr:uncharacterized protein GSPATT00017253001 [Paramecium tetraurelia]CAK82896.1 unnamed protein product [Paramecium tetraurelia]|eukprot:XP_001450293.1 hypothetical protein (macronuclear) [Paramecium tetraurelia strain d4-2]